MRVFNSAGKPVSVSKANPEETETDTDYDSSARGNGGPHHLATSVTSSSLNPTFRIDESQSSRIPSPNPPKTANLHLETVILPQTSPPMLRGSVLVRNLAFSKEVAIRFTLDDWQTTSEVLGKHVVSLPDLPPPFERTAPTLDVLIRGGRDRGMELWDRFSFSIRLEDFEHKLTERILWLVVRYQVPGLGEWWDNNDGANYKVAFQRAILSPPRDPMSPTGLTAVKHSFAPFRMAPISRWLKFRSRKLKIASTC